MVYDCCTTVSNCNILGYMSSGEIVPEVMMTEENLSKTGLMAIEASRQVKWRTGFGTEAVSDSKGSRMRRKPFRRLRRGLQTWPLLGGIDSLLWRRFRGYGPGTLTSLKKIYH